MREERKDRRIMKKRTRRRNKTGKANSRFTSLSHTHKMQSELKTHEEIASMKQEHWAEMQELWEEMMR